ncbi:hypothetical protein [Turneriella parva]|uniref:Glycosyltransferase RgtA/B/C/D-like domain-containing protein n=1 Tax=Turneriella parva (strain ATCC BAA-1111 / DSM 21527 / NCTC 11395 / H) TaxID=869212 RepID=I4B149_TURPD|nr:hypothetical protein [Turneriella parva]AFM11006.1 hypothetical protein Turpa_0346 [Turneriella parva DSM 21527]
MTTASLRSAWLYLPYACAAAYVAFLGTPWENTFDLAAQGRLDLKVAFFYRFRDAHFIEGFGFAAPAVTALLAAIKFTGSRWLWVTLMLMTGALAGSRSLAFRVFMLLPLAAAVFLGEAFLLWSLGLALAAQALSLLRQLRLSEGAGIATKLQSAACIMSLIFLALLIAALANPVHAIHRYRVLAGKAVSDRLNAYTGRANLAIDATCVALLNPDDLHGINAVEILAASTLRNFSELRLVDLKIVERNYKLLNLKNEKGDFIFSESARLFGKSESFYAEAQRPFWTEAESLCLVAAFETSPEKEEEPFSRARLIFDARKKLGKDTKIIRLPGR